MKGILTAALVLLAGCAEGGRTVVRAHSPASAGTAPAPEPTGWRVSPDAPFRANPPPADPQLFFIPPPIARRVLPNGVTLWIMSHPQLHSVCVRIQSSTPAQSHGYERALAVLAGEAAFLGTGDLDGRTIKLRFRSLLAKDGIGSSTDHAYVDVLTISSSFERILDLTSKLVMQPSFRPASLDWFRGRVVVSTTTADDAPAAVADRVSRQVVYGADHPYAQPTALSLEEAQRLTNDDIKHAYERAYAPGNVSVLVTGGVDPEKTFAALESMFGAWSTGSKAKSKRGAAAAVPPPAPDSKARIVVVDTPGAAKAEIVYGLAGPEFASPDFAALDVTRSALANVSSSALRKRIREELHLSWNVAMSLWTTRGRSPMAWRGTMEAGGLADALREFDKAAAALRAGALTQADLTLGAEWARARFESDLETAEEMADQLSYVAALGDDPALPARYLDRVDAVRPEDVRRVADQWFDTSRWRLVVVGDWKVLQSQLLGLGWGPVELRDAQGRVKSTTNPG